jgi:hypothetical protein
LVNERGAQVRGIRPACSLDFQVQRRQVNCYLRFAIVSARIGVERERTRDMGSREPKTIADL